MDGLLVDSEPLWTVAERELAVTLGGVWGDEVKAAVVGTRLDVAVPTILTWFGAAATPADVAATSAWLLQRMGQLYAGPVPVQPGATALLRAVHEAGIPQALVSSSYRALVDAVVSGPAAGTGPRSR